VSEGARLVASVLLAAWLLWLAPNAERPVVAAGVGTLTVAALWAARRWPIWALAAAFAGLLSAVHVAGYPGPDDPYIVIVVWASFGVGRYAPLRHQPWAAAGTLLLLSLNLLDAESVLPADLVFPTLFTAVPWLLGLFVKLADRRAETAVRYAGTLEAEGAEAVRQATRDERMRIAGELHDVVAHSVSGLSLQAQLARRRLEAGDAVTSEDLRQIETTAKDAMTELRRVLGVLRPAGEPLGLTPQEGLAQLPGMIERCRRSGQQLDLVELGEPRPLPPALSLAAYRIIQEAVTNARRHASGTSVELLLEWIPASLVLQIANNLTDAVAARSGGHGLLGMRERAQLFGGSFEAGPAPSGQWVVRAELPTPAPVRVGR
jgi:signal transduction histidine kinase